MFFKYLQPNPDKPEKLKAESSKQKTEHRYKFDAFAKSPRSVILRSHSPMSFWEPFAHVILRSEATKNLELRINSATKNLNDIRLFAIAQTLY